MVMLRKYLNSRRGAIAVLTAFLLVVILGMVACAFDTGWIVMTRTQLQAAADAAALAGGTALPAGLGDDPVAATTVAADIRQKAQDFASLNRNGDKPASYLDPDRDVQVGWAVFDPDAGAWEKHYGEELPTVGGYNLVRVTMHRNQVGSAHADTPLPLIFGPILGQSTSDIAAVATAVIMPAKGIRIEEGSSTTANVMPFSVNEYLWKKYLLAQRYYDASSQIKPDPAVVVADPSNVDPSVDPSDINRGWYSGGYWHNPPADPVAGSPPGVSEPLFGHFVTTEKPNGTTETIYVEDFDDQWRPAGSTTEAGADTILEVDIYPRDDYTAGNFGTIDLGSEANDTSAVARQIISGISDDDLAYYANGEFSIPRITYGDTGISSGFKDELDAVAGQCRVVYLFRGAVVNPGSNAEFDLRSLAGVRVMHTELTGNLDFKHLKLQRCDVTLTGGVGDITTIIGRDTTVFTPLILIE